MLRCLDISSPESNFFVKFLSFHKYQPPLAWRGREMILILSPLRVITADQCLSYARPIIKNLGSSPVLAGISMKSGSSHNNCASIKSIPCLFLFVWFFTGSYSNSIVYRIYHKYTFIVNFCNRSVNGGIFSLSLSGLTGQSVGVIFIFSGFPAFAGMTKFYSPIG